MLKRMEKDFEEAVVMDDFQETVSTRHNRTVGHMNSLRLWQQAQGLLYVQARWSYSIEKVGSGNGFPFLTKKLFENDNQLQRKNQFSAMESHWAH